MIDSLLTKLGAISEDGRITISTPFSIPVSVHDAWASEMLRTLFDAHPNATLGDILDVLDTARFWLIFLASQPEAEEKAL